MTIRAHKSFAGILFCALFLQSVVPQVVRSQEEEKVVASTSSAATVAAEEVVTVEKKIPNARDVYKTEALVGNQVFGDFALGPGKVERIIAPGETRTVMLEVANRMAESKIFDIEIEDTGGSSDPSRSVVLLGDDTGPYTLKSYLSVPVTQFELEPNRRALVPITISVPPDAEPGGRYGSVLVKTVARKADTSEAANPVSSSAIVSRIGTLFFITVPGDIETAGSLQEFSTIQDKTWYARGPINFGILFENTGSIHLNPYGELRINNMFGEEVGFEILDPWFTMPQSLRLREISWDRDLLYGRYTATLSLNRGYDDIVDEATVTFWVVPWKLLLAGFAGLVVIFFVFRAFFSRFEFKRKAN